MEQKKKILIVILVSIIVILLGISIYIMFFKDSGTNNNSSDKGYSSSNNSSSKSNSGSSDIVIVPDEPIASDLVDTQKLFMVDGVDYPLPEGWTSTEPDYLPKTVYVSVPETYKNWKIENNKWVYYNSPDDYSGFELDPRYRDSASGNTDYYKKYDRTSYSGKSYLKYIISIGGTIKSRNNKSMKYSNGEEALNELLIYTVSPEAFSYNYYNNDRLINVINSKDVIINGITMYNYEGIQEHDNNNIEKRNSIIGYAFAIDGAAYQISGILYDESYKDEMITMLTNIVKSVRTEK